MEKLITFAVPCYNSAAYMEHCVDTLLQGGDDIEIILVDDGSTKDETPAICDRYQERYPGIVRAIHQENGGHGEGVNQGIRNAQGVYYKVAVCYTHLWAERRSRLSLPSQYSRSLMMSR